MPLLFNTQSRFVVVFFQGASILISWLQSLSAVILECKKTKSVTISIVSPSICMKWWDQMRWSSFFECWVLSQLFQLFTCILINRLFTFSSLSAIREVSSTYKRLLIFLPGVLIPAWTSSSVAFLKTYSAYKLNKQGENIQPWHTPCPIFEPAYCSISSSHCYFFTCIQVSQDTGNMVWNTNLFKNFPVCYDPQSQRL